jgi:methionyl aminopeptidase
VCHGIPDLRELQDGDIVNVDVSAIVSGGWHADLNETFTVGSVAQETKNLIKVRHATRRHAMLRSAPLRSRSAHARRGCRQRTTR